MDTATRERTSIRITGETWRRLQRHKQQPGETLDETVRRLMDQVERLEARPGKRESAAEAGK